MKVAEKSPTPRRTLTLPTHSLKLLDELRGSTAKSAYLEQLLERERLQLEDARWVADMNAAYTPEVCEQTLRINDEYPIHEG